MNQYNSLTHRFVTYAIFVFCVALVSGCGTYGKIKPSREVTTAFTSFEVKKDHKYYMTGSDMYPDAIIAIDEKYTLTSKFWKEIEPEKLSDLVKQMNEKTPESLPKLYGYNILDNEGNDIGDWYSFVDETVIKVDGNKVTVYTPDIGGFEPGGDPDPATAGGGDGGGS